MAKEPERRPRDAGVFAQAADAVARGDDAGAVAVLAAAGLAAGAAAAGAAAGAAGAEAATQVMPAGPDVAGTRQMPTAGPSAGPTAGRPGDDTTDVGQPVPPPRTGRRRRFTGPLLALLALLVFLVVGALLADSLTSGDPGAAPTAAPTQAGTSAPGSAAPQTSAPPASEPPRTSSAPPSTSAPATEPATEPAGIEVVSADYQGLDKRDARRQLEGLGLTVEETRERETDAEKDTVLAVSEGTFAPGDTVTMVVADPRGTPGNSDKNEDD
jgi:serine/threonine-protein kinase